MGKDKQKGNSILKIIAERAKASHFGFLSENLGELSFEHLSVKAYSELEKKIPNFQYATSHQVAIKLFSIIAKKIKKGGVGDYTEIPLAESEIRLLENDELQEIAKIFIELNFDPNEIGFYVKKASDRDDYLDNLKKLLEIKREQYKEAFKPIRETLSGFMNGISGIFRPSKFEDLVSKTTIDLLKENQRFSNKLRDSLAIPSPSIPEQITIPKNPIYKTNEHLKNIEAYLNKLNRVNDDSSSLIKNLNDLGVQMTKDITLNYSKNSTHNKIMFYIGLFTIILTFGATLGVSYFSYEQYKEQNRNMNELIIHLKSEIELSRNAYISTKKDISQNINNFKISQKNALNKLQNNILDSNANEKKISNKLLLIEKMVLNNSKDLKSINKKKEQ